MAGGLARRFDPSKHPRDEDGKFKRKLSVGLRVSTRSASATVGKRYPIVPGKVNLYVGGLVRVESANRNKGPISRGAARIQDQAIRLLPDGEFRNNVQSLVKEGRARQGSTLISGTTGRRSRPTISFAQNDSSRREAARRQRAPRPPRPVITDAYEIPRAPRKPRVRVEQQRQRGVPPRPRPRRGNSVSEEEARRDSTIITTRTRKPKPRQKSKRKGKRV